MNGQSTIPIAIAAVVAGQAAVPVPVPVPVLVEVAAPKAPAIVPEKITKLDEKGKEEFIKRLECPYCKERYINACLVPCNHTMCSICFDRLDNPKKCPKCSIQPVTSHIIHYGGGSTIFKQKYLKYKQKYLQLKNK
jgi:hypothetical protein